MKSRNRCAQQTRCAPSWVQRIVVILVRRSPQSQVTFAEVGHAVELGDRGQVVTFGAGRAGAQGGLVEPRHMRQGDQRPDQVDGLAAPVSRPHPQRTRHTSCWRTLIRISGGHEPDGNVSMPTSTVPSRSAPQEHSPSGRCGTCSSGASPTAANCPPPAACVPSPSDAFSRTPPVSTRGGVRRRAAAEESTDARNPSCPARRVTRRPSHGRRPRTSRCAGMHDGRGCRRPAQSGHRRAAPEPRAGRAAAVRCGGAGTGAEAQPPPPPLMSVIAERPFTCGKRP